MVLGGLFPRDTTDDGGLGNERWRQTGSTLLNIRFRIEAADTEVTGYTVTSNKTLFITKIIIISSSSWNGAQTISDDTTQKLTILDFPSSTSRVYDFPVPLFFNTDVTCTESATTGIAEWHMIGWEEQN